MLAACFTAPDIYSVFLGALTGTLIYAILVCWIVKH